MLNGLDIRPTRLGKIKNFHPSVRPEPVKTGPTLVASSPILGALLLRGIGYWLPMYHTAYMAYIAVQQSIPPIQQAFRRRLRQEQFAEGLGVSFATANRCEDGITTPQRVARTVIGQLATEEPGDGTS